MCDPVSKKETRKEDRILAFPAGHHLGLPAALGIESQAPYGWPPLHPCPGLPQLPCAPTQHVPGFCMLFLEPLTPGLPRWCAPHHRAGFLLLDPSHFLPLSPSPTAILSLISRLVWLLALLYLSSLDPTPPHTQSCSVCLSCSQVDHPLKITHLGSSQQGAPRGVLGVIEEG